MDELKNLIIIVQGLSAGTAVFRIVLLIFQNRYEEDKKPLHKKIRNVLFALILIELALEGDTLIRSYFV